MDVWEECFTDTGEKYLKKQTNDIGVDALGYYYNTITGQTSWEPDRDPSPPWMVCTTDTGDKYYYNPDTDQVCILPRYIVLKSANSAFVCLFE